MASSSTTIAAAEAERPLILALDSGSSSARAVLYDGLGRPVVVSAEPEATRRGAALLARRAIGRRSRASSGCTSG